MDKVEETPNSPEPKPEKPETTRNYTETSYGLTVKPFSPPPTEKAELFLEPKTGNHQECEKMKIESETGNITVTPSPLVEKGQGDEVPDHHIPGVTWRTPAGELKLIPPYQSKEYYDIPLYLRERIYDMSGQPIKDRIVSRYF